MQTILKEYATLYNRMEHFECDPIIFPRHFAALMQQEKSTLADVEIAGIIAAHLAWGRREMIVRDCRRAFDEMEWRPYDYVMAGNYKSDSISLHRTIKWSEFAMICANLKQFYLHYPSLEPLTPQQIRVDIYGMKPDLNCANKKIHMFRRWMVRNDGIV
ncbi:MAG: DUF2400 family protein, partial [Bacteroidales bacterium]|nr:DUF2400 family protein [Bacteroidales bacterium]